MPFIHNLPIERQYDIGKSWMKGIELALNSQEKPWNAWNSVGRQLQEPCFL